MKIKLNINDNNKTEEELDKEALEQDIVLYDYIERVNSGNLTPQEKKQRENFYKALGIGIKEK